MITLYGDNISDYFVSSKNIKIVKTVSLENPNYLFVYVDTENVKAGNYEIKLSNQSKPKHIIDYKIKKRKKGSSLREGYNSSDFIYLIMPDRFANGDTSNDSHPKLYDKHDRSEPYGRHGGDLQGIIDNLDYIEDLGMTAIWNTPVFESNDDQSSYHMYAATDTYKIDRRFGSNDKYKELSIEMRNRGMKLIMDIVPNHWGLDHYMVKDSPSKDWINRWEKYTGTSHNKEVFSDPYASKADIDENVKGWFTPRMADLNQKQPQFLKYLQQNAIWWIEFADLSGFRVDTYPYTDLDGVTYWVESIMREYPNFSIVAESWVLNPLNISYWQKNSPVAKLSGFNSHVTHVKDFALYGAVDNSYKNETPWWDQKVRKIFQVFQNDFIYANPHDIMVFLENHDTPRINSLAPSFGDFKLLMTLLSTVRGVPQTYYGTEINMQGNNRISGDPDVRRDFPGGWPEDERNIFSKKERNKVENEYYDFSSFLFNWRKNQSTIHYGKTMHYHPKDDVYTYFRYDDKQTIMIVLNFNGESQKLNLDRFKERIGQTETAINVFTKKSISLLGSLEIAAKTPIILTF
jgi:glycosidase